MRSCFELARLRPYVATLLPRLGTGQSAHGVDHESAAWDTPPPNIWLLFSSSNSKFTNE